MQKKIKSFDEIRQNRNALATFFFNFSHIN